ncbi:hypothetical protein H4I96_06598 [Botrytis cinerea]
MTTTRSGLNSASNVKQKLNTKQKRKTKAKTTPTRKNAQSTPENTKSASKTMITRSSERIADARLKMKIAKASPKNTPSSSRTMVTRSSGINDEADEAGEGVGRDNVGDADANANATPMFIPMHIVELDTTSNPDLIPSMTADGNSPNLGYLMEMGSEAEPESELALGLDPGLEYHGTGDDYLLSLICS